MCVRGCQLETKAPLADFKGQTAVSVIVDQPTLGGIFPSVLGKPVFECGIVGADLDHAVCFVKIEYVYNSSNKDSLNWAIQRLFELIGLSKVSIDVMKDASEIYNQYIAIENIEFTEASRELVRQYSEKKMGMKAYEDVSQRTSNIAAQQKIAQGIQDNGFGNVGGMIMGMNVAQGLGAQAEPKQTLSFDQQIETLKKLKELLDTGILSKEEFDAKKKEIMGL